MPKRAHPSGNKMPPKRKKQAEQSGSEDEQEDHTCLVLYEQVAQDRLYTVAMLFIDNPEEDEKVMKYFNQYSTNRMSRMRVVYKPTKTAPLGRLYAQGNSMHHMSKWVRNLVLHEIVHDIDMSKSGNKIIQQVFMKTLGWAPGWNKRYVDNRDELLEAWVRAGIPVTKDSIKIILQHVATLGKVPSRYAELGIPEGGRYQPFQELQRDFRRAYEELSVHADFSALFAKCSIDDEVTGIVEEKERKTKALRLFAGAVIQEREIILLKSMHEHLTKTEKLHVSVLVHDGLTVERLQPFPALLDLNVLRRTEAHVLAATGYEIELAEKSMAPTAEDWARYNGARCLNKMFSPEEKAREVAVSEAFKFKFMRRGEDVVKLHPTIPGVSVTVMKLTEFVQRAFETRNFAIGPKEFRQVIDWCSTCPDKRFPLQPVPTKRFINFINGCYNLDDERWCTYDTLGDEVPYTNHYFERVVTEDDINGLTDTPIWDKIIDLQMPFDVKQMLEGMVGRLFFPIGTKDNWQVMPYCMGDANTGKSTVVDIARAMFPIEDVGCISSTLEKTFGLSSLHQCRVVVSSDLPINIHKVLGQTEFQSMVTGEQVSLAVKNKSALVNKSWTVPLIWAGNFFLSYPDSSGAIARRVVCFVFKKLVEDRDTTLKTRLVATELVPLIFRFLLRYKAMRDMVGQKDFWKQMPKTLLDMNETAKTNGNTLADFLDNGSSHHLVEREEGAFTLHKDLNDTYHNYMKFQHKIDGAKLPEDEYMFKVRGYSRTRWWWCEICHNQTNAARCGPHYVGPKKGYRPNVYLNLKLTKLHPPAQVFRH